MEKIIGFDLLKVGEYKYDFKLKNGKKKRVYEIIRYNENEIEYMTNGMMFLAEYNDVRHKKETININEIAEIVEK